MTDARCTLVAYDFSASSQAALDYALLLAGEEPSIVRVVHVVPLPMVPMGPGEVMFMPDLDTSARSELDRALRDAVLARKITGIAVETQLLLGPAPNAIVNEAIAHGCQRIVVGSSRPGPFARVLLGSVADRVVRTSSVDVVVVPAPVEGARSIARIRNVVCATDFSAPAETALLHALEIVRAHRARLHLVHAWELAPYVERVPELRASIERELSQELEATAHRHEAPGVPILRQLRRGHPPEELARAATELEADLVVVGTTGKRGVDHLLLGSVAERVARTSPAPVLVARALRTGSGQGA